MEVFAVNFMLAIKTTISQQTWSSSLTLLFFLNKNNKKMLSNNKIQTFLNDKFGTIIKKGNRNFVYETLTRKRPINKTILLVNYEIIEIEKKVAKFSLSFDYLRIQIHKVATTISIRGVLK